MTPGDSHGKAIETEYWGKSLMKLLFPKRFPGKVRGASHPLDVDSIVGALMVVRMDAIARVGFFDVD